MIYSTISYDGVATTSQTDLMTSEETGTASGHIILNFNIQPEYVDISYAVVGAFGCVINTFIFIILLTQRSKNANLTEYLMMEQVGPESSLHVVLIVIGYTHSFKL